MNLLDPSVIENPYVLYEHLRSAGGPVHVPELDFWLISRYADCQDVLNNTDVFRSQGAVAHLAARHPDDPPAEHHYDGADVLAAADPPDHTHQRRLFNRVFSSRRAAREWEDQIRELANGLVDGFVAQGRVDLVRQFADPLPTMVIADVLGVPNSDWAQFKQWSEAVVAPLSGTLSFAEIQECTRQVNELAAYLEADLRGRTADSPGLLTALLHAHEPDDEPLSTAELVSIALQVLEAGNNTTTHVIGTTMWLLLRDEELLRAATADPDVLFSAIEEGLRFESPVQGLFRRSVAEATVAGVTIPAGAKVFVLFASANRDEEVFPHAATFDAGRENARRNMAFGYGIHRCAGEHLGRLEVQIAAETLLRRLPGLRLAADETVVHHPHFILRGPRALWVEFDPPGA